MKIRHPVLLAIIVIIGVGMINSLFQDPPAPPDPKIAEREMAEKGNSTKIIAKARA
jgi:hypothetical protein